MPEYSEAFRAKMVRKMLPPSAASEASGLDRTLKTNTSKKRTMSLFNQGFYRYSCLDTMRDDRLERLLAAYEKIVREHEFPCEILKFDAPPERGNRGDGSGRGRSVWTPRGAPQR